MPLDHQKDSPPLVEKALPPDLVTVGVLAILELLEEAVVGLHQPVDDDGSVDLHAFA